MSADITFQQFLLKQPNFPEEMETDRYYYDLACRLCVMAKERNLMRGWPVETVSRVVLALVGYFQDVIADGGLWRTFIKEHHRLYGKWLPFYDTSEESGYMEYEFNAADVRFIVWYTAVMYTEERRVTSPLDASLMEAADIWSAYLDSVYDESPEPRNYNIARGLEMDNPEEMSQVLHLGQWLFLHSYLLTPAYSITLSELLSESDVALEGDVAVLQNRLEHSMIEDPTGPLALYLHEWLYLLLEDRMPPCREELDGEEIHAESKYYRRFVDFTGGDIIQFFGSYDELNKFFIQAMGWDPDEKHFSQLEQSHDFVLMVNPQKGMLLAHDICRSIKYPSNPYYDREYALTHAIGLLTMRGMCPPDLLQFLLAENAIPDACFPDSDDTQLVASDADFIARLYLQKYYRGD